MKSSTAAPKSPTVWLLRGLGVVVPVLAVGFLFLQQADVLVARALAIAYGDSVSEYRGTWFEWDGDVVAKELVIHPAGAGAAATIRFDGLHVETPGWFWFMRNVFDRKLDQARLDRLHLTLSGAEASPGLDLTLGDIGPFGAASASPFDAEGCMRHTTWVREDFEKLGLQPDPTQLEFDYRVDGNDLRTTIVLESRRASRVQFERRSRLTAAISALKVHQHENLTSAEQWEVQDQGFVSARNRYCAKTDGIDARRFIERHVEAVARLLETRGLAVDAESRIAYRRFARDGGKFIFSAEYATALASERFFEGRDNPDTLAGMNALIDYNGRAKPVLWQRLAPRPLPGLEAGEPTFAALQKELAAAIRGDAVVATSADPSANAVAATPPPATTATTATTAPAPSPVAASATARPTVPVPTISKDPVATETPVAPGVAKPVVAKPVATAPKPTPVTPSESAPIASVARPEPPAQQPQQPVVPKATDAPPAVVAKPAEAAKKPQQTSIRLSSAPTRPSATGVRLQWNDLPKYRGRMIRVWTIHNPPRTVELLAADDAALRVQVKIGGGRAEYTIQREGFLRANLVR